MWVAEQKKFHNEHTDLTKYFIEKLKQQVDFDEIISNRHRTTNGYTLISEIVEVSKLTLKRIKSIHRLISLINESKSKEIKSSIINDFILNKYHSDIIEFYKNIDEKKLKENQQYVADILHQSIINVKRLESKYLNNIMVELKLINFDSNKFERNAKKIDQIIECLIPYLIFKGYSATSISDISFRFIEKAGGSKIPIRIVNKFRNKLSDYQFLLRTSKNSFEMNVIKDYLSNKEIVFKEVEYKEINKNYFFENPSNEETVFLLINKTTIDPHNYLRNLYEVCLKKYVISKDRMDLSSLNDFFERVFWKFNTTTHNFQKSNFNIDPINVSKRKSTLFDTLIKLSKFYDYDFEEKSVIPYINSIADSLYYYNLALGSKSIENSLSLMWTSLETLLPYRMKDNDIMNVQHFVSKSLGVGVIGREVASFALRYYNSNWVNSYTLNALGIATNYINYKTGIKIYLEWLTLNYDEHPDPYNILKSNSNLLCRDFCLLNDRYNGKKSTTVQYWIDKIKSSELAITYQLDRIYLHRNQVVHSGKFINEYSNLWSHLEWYVGKLLSYCVLSYFDLEEKSKFDKKEIFYNLEAYTENLKNQLKNNSDKKISDISFLYDDILKQSWQFF
jgi:hypothetical protein